MAWLDSVKKGVGSLCHNKEGREKPSAVLPSARKPLRAERGGVLQGVVLSDDGDKNNYLLITPSVDALFGTASARSFSRSDP